jgi:hypothetical protein
MNLVWNLKILTIVHELQLHLLQKQGSTMKEKATEVAPELLEKNDRRRFEQGQARMLARSKEIGR